MYSRYDANDNGDDVLCSCKYTHLDSDNKRIVFYTLFADCSLQQACYIIGLNKFNPGS